MERQQAWKLKALAHSATLQHKLDDKLSTAYVLDLTRKAPRNEAGKPPDREGGREKKLESRGETTERQKKYIRRIIIF